MSIWSKIAKAALAVAPLAVAPFTGGASLAALPSILKMGVAGASALAGATGQGIGAATTASGANRLDQEKLALQAQGQNIQGLSEFERQLLARAELEDKQRAGGRQDLYRASRAANPRVSPYNPVGAPKYSPEFLQGISALGTEGLRRTTAPTQYSSGQLPAMTPYTPLDIKNVQGATGTQKGILEKAGDWAGPGLSILSKLLKQRAQPSYAGGE